MKNDDDCVELCEALSYFTVEELKDEIINREHGSLDLIDKQKLDEIIAVFCAANWAERSLIYKTVCNG